MKNKLTYCCKPPFILEEYKDGEMKRGNLF